MSIDKRVKKIEKRIDRLHKERSAAWSGDEKEYWRINRALNRARVSLDRLLLFASRNQIDTNKTLPVYTGNTGAAYVRYETLPDSIRSEIYQLDYLEGSHLYATKNGMAISLKDAWADVQGL